MSEEIELAPWQKLVKEALIRLYRQSAALQHKQGKDITKEQLIVMFGERNAYSKVAHHLKIPIWRSELNFSDDLLDATPTEEDYQ